MIERKASLPLDLDKCTLWGDKLRVLLNSGQISYGEINSTLREKGIFIDSSEKAIIVPLLCTCLLTPREFSRLISRSYTRESLEKYKTDKVQLINQKDAEWLPLVVENFETLISGITLDSSCEFTSAPIITQHPSGEIEIVYTIKREDYSRDFLHRELEFSGGIVISQKGGELVLEFQKTHTSKETDLVNSILVKTITGHLKNNNVILDSKPKSIKFDDFTNEERVWFFLKLTGIATADLTFIELVEVEMLRDESAGSLPNDPAINWMEGKVRRIKVGGEKLDQLGLIKSKAFHHYCQITKMNATYRFQQGGTGGECGICFWFGKKSSYDRDFSGAEFNISIEKLPRISKESEFLIRKNILRSLFDFRDSAISELLAKRNLAHAA